MRDRPLTVALPKGRLGEQVYARFAAAGYPCPGVTGDSRRLIFETEDGALRYFWSKPSDVGVYVERGAADVGVCGRDILLEHRPEVYEMLDLGLGRCRMAVAARHGFRDDRRRTLRVATKFRRIAEDYYASLGRDIDVIHLNGSIELAPILDLSDVIVDIVETGTTLKENGLEVVETILPISARLIVNKASFAFRRQPIEALIAALTRETEGTT